jgi:hypothetical protein
MQERDSGPEQTLTNYQDEVQDGGLVDLDELGRCRGTNRPALPLLLRVDAEVGDAGSVRGSTSKDQDDRIGRRRVRIPRVTAHTSARSRPGSLQKERMTEEPGKKRENGKKETTPAVKILRPHHGGSPGAKNCASEALESRKPTVERRRRRRGRCPVPSDQIRSQLARRR